MNNNITHQPCSEFTVTNSRFTSGSNAASDSSVASLSEITSATKVQRECRPDWWIAIELESEGILISLEIVLELLQSPFIRHP